VDRPVGGIVEKAVAIKFNCNLAKLS
jgi:hypothetical protein